MRLIDADELKLCIDEECFLEGEDKETANYCIDVAPTINTVPTESEFKRIAIQRGYVPVVRCEECRYFIVSKVSKTAFCNRHEKIIRMKPKDYCSYGERINDD